MSSTLPPFLERMNAVFASERSNQFLLLGNVRDIVDARSLPKTSADEAFMPTVSFLLKRLSSRGHTPIRYDIGQGIRFHATRDHKTCRKAFGRGNSEREKFFDQLIQESRHDPAIALQALAECCRLELKNPVSVVIEYAELLFPNSESAHLSDSDRRRLALLRDWLGDPRFHAHRGALFIVAETAASIHQHVRSLPQLMSIDIPLPDLDARLAFMNWMQAHEEAVTCDETPERLASFTAGMSLSELRSLFLDARHAGEKLTRRSILNEVNRLLAARIGDHIEIVEPHHGLDQVIGQSALKQELDRQRQLMEQDDPQLSPVGILAAGPNGTGKTFLYSAWAASCKRIVVVLKNLRGSYFGETDRIFEQVRTVLEALGNVIVLIDEADTQFGKPGDQTHETEARLFGALIRMMGDPKNRGRIVWVLLTARPERLAPDLKRSGRAGLHLPVFDPEGPDREAFLHYTLKQAGMDYPSLPADSKMLLSKRTEQFAPADFEELSQQLRAEIALGNQLNNNALVAILDNLRPIDISSQRRLQTLQAIMHCSRNNLVPESFRDIDRASISAELQSTS